MTTYRLDTINFKNGEFCVRFIPNSEPIQFVVSGKNAEKFFDALKANDYKTDKLCINTLKSNGNEAGEICINVPSTSGFGTGPGDWIKCKFESEAEQDKQEPSEDTMFERLERLLGIYRNFIKIAADYIPEYKTDGSACFDIQSSGNYTFNTNDLHVVGTGIRSEIPKGWCLLIFAHSSLGLKRLIIPNSVGVIDSDYRGEIKIPLIYLGTDPLVIEKGQRIAQGMLIESRKARFIKTTKLSDTSRGNGGFGSTGEK